MAVARRLQEHGIRDDARGGRLPWAHLLRRVFAVEALTCPCCGRPMRVLVHDAVSYMASRADLAGAIATAFEHTAPGGVAMFQPDFVSESFGPGTETGGSDAGGRALRYLERCWQRAPGDSAYLTDMAYLLRNESGAVVVVHDRYVMGLFPRVVWLEPIAAAGFEPLTVPFAHSSCSDTGREVFLGLRPFPDERS